MGPLEIFQYSKSSRIERDTVASLLVEFSVFHSKNHSDFQPVNLKTSQAHEILNLYEQPDHSLLIAQSELSIIGCVGLRPFDNSIYENTCEMQFLFVKAAFRGFGFGHQLLGSFIDLARQKNYSHVLFDPIQQREGMRQLYSDFGFVEIPPLDSIGNLSASLMILSL